MDRHALLLATLLFAATATAAPAPGPLDQAAPTAPLVYDSAFQDYRSDQTPVLADWRHSNAMGGAVAHAGHDMRQPAPQPSTAAPKPQPAPDPHAAHHHP